MGKFIKGDTFIAKKFKGLLLVASLTAVLVYINQIVDNVITANTLGTVALSATTICAPLMTAAGFIGTLLGSGTTESIGNWLWVGEREKAERLFSYGVIMSVLAGVIFYVVTLIFKMPLLHLFGVTDRILDYANDYYSLIIVAGLIQPLFAFYTGVVFISGDSKRSALSSIVQLAANIVISLLLCPVLGTAGAAIGTICGTGCGLLVLSTHFMGNKNRIKFTFRIKAKYIKKSVNFTLIWTMPAVYNIIIVIWLNNTIVGTIGDNFLPLTAVVSAMLTLVSFFEALSNADNPLVGTYSAENNIERCQQIMRSVALFSLIVGGIILVISQFFPETMLSWFGISDVEYLTGPGRIIVRYMSVGLIIIAVGTVFNDYYFYLQFHAVSLLIQAMMQLIFPIVFVILFGEYFGFEGMLVGYIIACILPYIVGIPIIHKKYGKDMFPYMMKPEENVIMKNFDIRVESDQIMKLRNEIEEFLRQNGVSEKVILRALLMLEETGMLILEKNKGKKVFLESAVKISKEEVMIVTRDNGIIFDITDADMSITSFRAFVLSRMMDEHKNKLYFSALNYNRNGFSFILKDNPENA